MLRGVPPPELGSFEYNLFTEGLRREKSEKLAFARLLVGMGVAAGFFNEEKGKLLLYEYQEDLYQFRYNYGYVPIGEQVAKIQKAKKDEDMRLLKKVAAMSEGVDDAGSKREI